MTIGYEEAGLVFDEPIPYSAYVWEVIVGAGATGILTSICPDHLCQEAGDVGRCVDIGSDTPPLTGDVIFSVVIGNLMTKEVIDNEFVRGLVLPVQPSCHDSPQGHGDAGSTLTIAVQIELNEGSWITLGYVVYAHITTNHVADDTLSVDDVAGAVWENPGPNPRIPDNEDLPGACWTAPHLHQGWSISTPATTDSSCSGFSLRDPVTVSETTLGTLVAEFSFD